MPVTLHEVEAEFRLYKLSDNWSDKRVMHGKRQFAGHHSYIRQYFQMPLAINRPGGKKQITHLALGHTLQHKCEHF